MLLQMAYSTFLPLILVLFSSMASTSFHTLKDGNKRENVSPKMSSESFSEEIMNLAENPAAVAWLKSLRRKLHEYPEVAFKEFKTSEVIRSELDRMNIRYRHPLARTGVRAWLGTGNPPLVGLRADMDALPIQEAVEWEHKSRIAGHMHACGHDAHVTMLLGAAMILKHREHLLQGTVVLIFQPAEEAGNGAKQLIEDGGIDDVNAIFAVHVSHQYPTGVIGSRPGPLLAGCGFFQALIQPIGPAADPILATSMTVISLQSIVSRETDPLDPNVVSVTTVQTATDAVTIGGTFRSFSRATFAILKQRIHTIITAQTAVNRCTATVDFFDGKSTTYPPTTNDEEMYAHVRRVATTLLGEKMFAVVPPMMGAEDFAFYSEIIPAAYYFIGIRNETLGSVHSGHSPLFTIDENALHVGAAVHAAIAERYLNGRNSLN